MQELIIKYPSYVKKALDRIAEAGHEAFVVGGAVRDAILGRTINDYDITTSATPEETADIFSDLHVIMTGIKHGTVTVVIDHKPIEITTYRVDGDYKDSRHPDGVRFTRNIEDDLSRRDFTVNAMAHNEKRGLVDLFGGKADLEAKLIRAVGEPQRRFEEDALRIMRAFRFASKLGFDIAEETLDAARKCRKGLEHISNERKTVELEGIMLGERVKKALLLMNQTKIFDVIMPDISLDLTRFNSISELPSDFACRMAFCLVGQKSTDVYISSLRLSNAVSGKMKKLVHLAEERLDADSDPTLRRLMSRAGNELGELLAIKKALGENTEGIAERARRIIERGDCLNLKSLAVDGRDLTLMGIGGKEVGEILAVLLEAVLDDPTKNDRLILLDMARELQSRH